MNIFRQYFVKQHLAESKSIMMALPVMVSQTTPWTALENCERQIDITLLLSKESQTINSVYIL